MTEFEKNLNELLVGAFRSILKIEERTLSSSSRAQLSISEMHLLEAVGTGEKGQDSEMKISTVSKLMGITLPSVTVAVNKLVAKGYLVKEKCTKDGRVMYVRLTELGKKMNRVHAYFHIRLVREVSKELSEDEQNTLLEGISKLNMFFKKKMLENG